MSIFCVQYVKLVALSNTDKSLTLEDYVELSIPKSSWFLHVESCRREFYTCFVLQRKKGIFRLAGRDRSRKAYGGGRVWALCADRREVLSSGGEVERTCSQLAQATKAWSSRRALHVGRNTNNSVELCYRAHGGQVIRKLDRVCSRSAWKCWAKGYVF